MSYQRKDQGGDQRGYTHVHHPKWEVLEEVEQWQWLFGSGKRDSLRRRREERIDYTPHRLNEYTKPSSSPFKSPSTLPRTYDRRNLHGRYPTLTTWPMMQSWPATVPVSNKRKNHNVFGPSPFVLPIPICPTWPPSQGFSKAVGFDPGGHPLQVQISRFSEGDYKDPSSDQYSYLTWFQINNLINKLGKLLENPHKTKQFISGPKQWWPLFLLETQKYLAKKVNSCVLTKPFFFAPGTVPEEAPGNVF